MPVKALDHEDDDSGQQPLPEGRIPVVDSVDEQKDVEQTSASPVDDLEGDEPELRPEELDAAHCHEGDDQEDHKSGDRRDNVGLYALPEGGVEGGVQAVGAEVGEEVDDGPKQQANGHHQVEKDWLLERKYLQVG